VSKQRAERRLLSFGVAFIGRRGSAVAAKVAEARRVTGRQEKFATEARHSAAG
jgi:hypothetical protein